MPSQQIQSVQNLLLFFPGTALSSPASWSSSCSSVPFPVSWSPLSSHKGQVLESVFTPILFCTIQRSFWSLSQPKWTLDSSTKLGCFCTRRLVFPQVSVFGTVAFPGRSAYWWLFVSSDPTVSLNFWSGLFLCQSWWQLSSSSQGEEDRWAPYGRHNLVLPCLFPSVPPTC